GCVRDYERSACMAMAIRHSNGAAVRGAPRFSAMACASIAASTCKAPRGRGTRLATALCKCASRVPAGQPVLVRERQSSGAPERVGDTRRDKSPGDRPQANIEETAMRRIARLLQLTAFGLLLTLHQHSASAAQKTEFKVAWSIYVGWMPWDYAESSGILKKWADKYGIRIEMTQINDYVESINQYTAGQYDGCVMTNMDMLTLPAAGGVDSTALIIGDYSNGNDGIVLKGAGKNLADIKGQQVNLVELSVSHYLLARALGTIGLAERDVKVVNTSDADIVAASTAAS